MRKGGGLREEERGKEKQGERDREKEREKERDREREREGGEKRDAYNYYTTVESKANPKQTMLAKRHTETALDGTRTHDYQVSMTNLSIHQLSYQDCTQNDNPFIHTVTEADNARRTAKSRDPGGDFGIWERGG